ncbi:hypothetical protein [Xanthomonas sp. 3307]|uniref:hypothetical protein n=1 Tax=Xanthomonas sp. 3307 TaxID=3035316 RepID=UPI001608F9CA|nr:hypothetical protein [Xanthomonas sp. 3307]MBB5942491.1 hypothetical protein [Xanthomonas sp. 3307]
MGDLLKFLNDNSGALTVIFTGVVTLATAVYAALTWQLVSETRRMRKVQTEPKLEVTLRSVDEAIHIQRLHVRNIGLGPALQIAFNPKVLAGGEGAKALLDELTETNFFHTGISYLGPGEERYSHFTQMHEDHDVKVASVLAFDISYRSATKETYSETLVIDMSERKGSYQLGKPHLYSIAQSLEKLQKDFGHLARGFKRIRADIYTSDDRAAEKNAMREHLEKARAERGT